MAPALTTGIPQSMMVKLRQWLFGASAFLLPTFPKVVPLTLIAALVLSAVTNPPQRKSWKQLSDMNGAWLVLFYLLHVVAMFWTSNTGHGLFDLQVKLTYLLLPIAFWFYPVNEQDIRLIKWGFIGGLAVASAACLGRAVYRYFDIIQYKHHFFSSRLIWHIHRGYFAMYLVYGLILCANEFKQQTKPSPRTKFILGSLTALFIAMISLSMAKMGVVALLIIMIIAGIRAMLKAGNKVKSGLILLGGLAIVITSILANETARNRFSIVWTSITNVDNLDKTSVESSQVRLFVWDSAMDLIKEAPILGHGTGDIKDVLRAKNEANGYTGALKKDLNPHSQYFQTGISLGLLGVLTLVIGWITTWIKAYRVGNWLGESFAILLVLSMLTESVMEVHAGVLFVTFIGLTLGYQQAQKNQA